MFWYLCTAAFQRKTKQTICRNSVKKGKIKFDTYYNQIIAEENHDGSSIVNKKY